MDKLEFLVQFSIFFLENFEVAYSTFHKFIYFNKQTFETKKQVQNSFIFICDVSSKKTIALFLLVSIPLPIPEFSAGMTFGKTGVLSDVVNEI